MIIAPDFKTFQQNSKMVSHGIRLCGMPFFACTSLHIALYLKVFFNERRQRCIEN